MAGPLQLGRRKTTEADGVGGANQTWGDYGGRPVQPPGCRKSASTGKHHKGTCKISAGIQTPRLGSAEELLETITTLKKIFRWKRSDDLLKQNTKESSSLPFLKAMLVFVSSLGLFFFFLIKKAVRFGDSLSNLDNFSLRAFSYL